MGQENLELVRALEERCFNAWPTLRTQLVDGWIFRLADGHTRRANSASPVHASSLSAAELSRLVQATFHRAGLKPVIRLTPLAPSALGRELAGLGWQEDDPSLGLYAPQIRGAVAQGDLLLENRVTEDWINEAMRAYGHGEAGAQALRRMLDNGSIPTIYATLWHEGRAVGWGMAATERGMVGSYDLVIDPALRGQGFGRRLVAGLLHWGQTQEAGSAYLQVRIGNEAAGALYAQFGFQHAYGYTHYILARGDQCAAHNQGAGKAK